MKIGSIRKTYGERIRFHRRKRGMTQKALGLELGFQENGADVRIAQYETGGRCPGEKTIEKLAEKLYVSSAALAIPDMTVDEVMHFLFALEDRYGIRPHVSIDGKFTGIDFSESDLSDRIREWYSTMKFLVDKSYRDVIYDSYRYSYPKNSRFGHIEDLRRLQKMFGKEKR